MIIRKGIIIVTLAALIVFSVGFITTLSFQNAFQHSNINNKPIKINNNNIGSNNNNPQQMNSVNSNLFKEDNNDNINNNGDDGNNNKDNDNNNKNQIVIIKNMGNSNNNINSSSFINMKNNVNYSSNVKNNTNNNYSNHNINSNNHNNNKNIHNNNNFNKYKNKNNNNNNNNQSNNKIDPIQNLQNLLDKLDKINQNQNSNYNKQKLPRLNNPFNKIDKVYKKNQVLNQERASKVKESMKFAWDSYKSGAWGHDEWLPTERHYSDWLGGYGLTIIDSLDTLYIMDLKQELDEGKKWVSELLLNKSNSDISVFEFNIRYLGSILSMYDLTDGDNVYYNKAIEIGDLLMHAFSEDSPFPASFLNIETKETKEHDNGCVMLAPLGTMSLEFARLSHITGNLKYKNKIDKIIDAMSKMVSDKKGLFKTLISKDGKRYCSELISIGAQGDSYYEYLLKMWIYTDGEEQIYKRLFEESADSIIKYLYRVTKAGFGYIANYDYGSIVHREEHLTCFAGGMFALAAASNITGNDEKNEIYWEVGKQVTSTCANSYFNSPIGLGPETFNFNPDGTISYTGINWYLLRPETIESLFILYRLTGDEIYQDWGWRIYESIENKCKLENGYVGYKDLIYGTKDSTQQSFFLAETLKYLYLLYVDSNTIPLDKYVLNTEAHPLLIKYK